MLNTKEMRATLGDLMAKTTKEPYVAGLGVRTGGLVAFDEAKLEAYKETFANKLCEMGIDEYPLVALSSFTKLKNGKVWNQLQTMEDFEVLDLMVACAAACGFIINDSNVLQMNINEIGAITSILISKYGRVGTDDATWLQYFRNLVLKKMYFLTQVECIKNFATTDDNIEKVPSHK